MIDVILKRFEEPDEVRQMVKGRYVIKQISPDKYTWTWDMSFGSGGGAWTQVAEGTDTRIK